MSAPMTQARGPVSMIYFRKSGFTAIRLCQVSRLDKDATGLILLTDITELIHDLTSPKRHVEKTYRVTVESPIDVKTADIFHRTTDP